MISNIIPPGDFPFSRSKQASCRVVSKLLNTPISGFYREAIAQSSPSPYVVDKETMQEMETLHEAIVKGVRAVVQKWPKNTHLRDMIPLHPRIEKVLLTMEREPFKIGTFRPDILLPVHGPLQVCEINARFPLNGFLSSVTVNELMHRETATEDSVYAELELSAVSGALSFTRDLRKKLLGQCHDSENIVWLVYGKEPEHDTNLVEPLLGTPLRLCPLINSSAAWKSLGSCTAAMPIIRYLKFNHASWNCTKKST